MIKNMFMTQLAAIEKLFVNKKKIFQISLWFI